MPIYKDGKNKNDEGLQRYKVRVNYHDSQGNYKQMTRIAYGLQQAKQLEIALQSEKKEPAQGLTVQDAYKLYYESKKHEIRETTLEKINNCYTLYISPFLSTYKLSKLNITILQKWKQFISAKSLSVRTKKNIYAHLRSFLNWCVKNSYISESPLSKIDNFRDPYATPKQDKLRYYTAQQFKQYITVALAHAEKTHNYSFYTFFMIAFYTGMRKGEINALKWSDIEGDKIHVKRSIAQKLKGEDRETPPKNKSSYRTLQCPLALMKALEAQSTRHASLASNISSLRVCGGDSCLRDTTIDKHNRTYAESANLPRIKIHEFRHSHASLLANAGINIQEIARRLGHAKIEQTWNTYAHLYPKEEERAIAVLDSI